MRLFITLALISLLIIGCSEDTQEQIPDDDQEPIPSEDSTEETSPPEIPVEEPKEPEKCESDISPDYITDIDLSIFTEGLNKTEDGFTFRIIPLDDEGNIVPTGGNVALTLYSTKQWNDELVRDLDILRKSIQIDEENVNADCTSEPIFISFDEIKRQENYRYVDEDDPGILRIVFRRPRSNDLYEIGYEPFEHGEDITP